MSNNLRISFIAPTGFGKSTAGNIVVDNFEAKVIKLAEPLYAVQKFFYDMIGKNILSQDGELLQFLGQKVQNDFPNFLFEFFCNKMDEILNHAPETIIVNDDCRPGNYEKLKNLGFIFIKIEGKRYYRDDISPINPSHPLEWREDILFDYVVSNLCDIDEFASRIIAIVDALICDKGIVCKMKR
jgi:hypothetical protein